MYEYPYLNTITGTVHKTLSDAVIDATYDLLNGYIDRDEIPDGDIHNIIIDLRKENSHYV